MKYIPFFLLFLFLVLFSSCGYHDDCNRDYSPRFQGAQVVNLSRPGAPNYFPGERIGCTPIGLVSRYRNIMSTATFSFGSMGYGNEQGVMSMAPFGSGEIRCTLSMQYSGRGEMRTMQSFNSLQPAFCSLFCRLFM